MKCFVDVGNLSSVNSLPIYVFLLLGCCAMNHNDQDDRVKQ